MNNNQNLNSLPTFPTQGMPATNPSLPEAPATAPTMDGGANNQAPSAIPSPVPSAIPTADPTPSQETSGNKFINVPASSPVPEATLAPVPESADNNSNNTFINNAGPTDTSLPGQDAPAPTPVPTAPAEPSSYGESAIEGLNVKGNYNQLEKEPDYVNDPQVRENMNPTKKNTVTISKELKTVIIIAIVLLVFIFVIPTIFELINKARFN